MADEDATPLVTVEELEGKLPFDLSVEEKREAARSLEELSDDARHYGSSKWESEALAPRQVKNLVLKAAARHMKNYEGLQTSRAGDESVTFFEGAGDAQFTKDEKRRLSELGGNYRATVQTVGLYHSTNRPALRRGVDPKDTVPVADPGSAKPFPYITDPW